jgi:ornithine cyclodeaminase
VTGLTFITGAQVTATLTLNACIPLMRRALSALASSEARQMWRPVLPLHARNVLGLMPAYDPGAQVAGVKVLSVFPDNYLQGVPSHQGVIVLFETESGSIMAVVDAEAVTAVRTAAASAAATDALARPDATDLAILGAGTQGWQHLRAMALVRQISRVTVWDLYPERAQQFARRAAQETGLSVTACGTAAQATDGADIICTVTSSAQPIIGAQDVKPGAHINAVGACTPEARELAADLMAASRLFVDWRPATIAEAGDYLLALKEGAITEQQILGEVGAVLNGSLPGRASESDITLFEALGQATQDLLAANYVADAHARQRQESA